MKVTAKDFDRLVHTSFDFCDELKGQLARFEGVEDDTVRIPASAKYLHWVGDNYAALILARQFLEDNGHSYYPLWDMAPCGKNKVWGYVIFTDYPGLPVEG